MTEQPQHVAENQRYWDAMAHEWVAMGERAWASEIPSWGQWGIPDDEYSLLPQEMSGLDAIELGCGTGYVSAWMARRGATVTAIDNSEQQLVTARRLATEHQVPICFVHGNAETVPRPDESFDFAISEYGAAIWCDPAVWLPEAHRLLRPGGRLVFLGNSPLTLICTPWSGDEVSYTLTRDYFELGVVDWTAADVDPGGIEFNRSISGWFRLFREVGFVIEDYHEIQAPDSASGTAFAVSAEWAKRYPSEQVWSLRKPESVPET